MSNLRKYCFFSDLHITPLDYYHLLSIIKHENPVGIMLGGDLNFGLLTVLELEFLAKHLPHIKLLLVLGNHCYHGIGIERLHRELKELCSHYKNLIWLDNADIEPLSADSAIIGAGSWHDNRIGNREFVKFSIDWFLIKELRELTWPERFDFMRKKADDDGAAIIAKLERALETYRTVYILTHFPPWIEANASKSGNKLIENFFLPYNINYKLGQDIERVMAQHKKRNVVVLTGHVHIAANLRIKHNIQCIVSQGSYIGLPRDQILYI